MRSTPVLPIKLLSMIFAGLLLGCSSVKKFPEVKTDSAENALMELMHRSRSIDFFEADAKFDLELDKDGEKLRLAVDGNVLYEEEYGWHIEITGPFGIKLADIESKDSTYKFHSPQTGRVREGLLSEKLSYKSINIELPNLKSLNPLLMPIFDFTDDAVWEIIDSDYSELGYMDLKQSSELNNEHVRLILEYAPLRVIEEHHYRDDRVIMTRSFAYSNDSDSMPDKIELRFDGLTVDLAYKFIRFLREAS